MKKSLKALSALCLSATVFAGCSSSSTEEKIPQIGVAQIVSHTSLNTIRDAFVAQMEELGYKDGETVNYDFADAAGQPSNLNAIMSQFADEDSDVIVAIATPTAQSAANYADQIPVVFSAVSDPVGAGLVKSLDKPDGNITGTSDEVQIDQIVALAKQIDPDLKTLGFLYNAGEANSVSNLNKAKEYCQANGIELIEGTGKDMTELQSSASVLAERWMRCSRQTIIRWPAVWQPFPRLLWMLAFLTMSVPIRWSRMAGSRQSGSITKSLVMKRPTWWTRS